jgi:hypothetical protein
VEQSGLYEMSISDSTRAVIAARSVDVHDTDVELEQTARNMAVLTQWAGVSEGLAFKVEECPQATDLVARIKARIQQARRAQQVRQVIGLNAGTLGLILACLTGEWLLRKRWALV